MRKKIIFHLPFIVDRERPSGSQIRPVKMIQAFEENHFNVELIEGDLNKRKKKIKELKNRINKGEKFDFVYSESSTMPNALTEKHHLPLNPFLDHFFLIFCKKQNIKIGLFYRDIYWMYPDLYNVPFFKKQVSTLFYRLDLFFYKKYVNTLYLPSLRMNKCIKEYDFNIEQLAPGTDDIIVTDKNVKKNFSEKEIILFYVGGVSKLYNFRFVIKAIEKLPFVKLIICTRKADWEVERNNFPLNDNVEIVHESGNRLKDRFSQVDICLSTFEYHDYWDFAIGVKNFEYIANLKPIIATKKTEVGDLVDKNEIGWTISPNKDKMIDLLNYLNENKNAISEKKKELILMKKKSLWKERARQVINDLTK